MSDTMLPTTAAWLVRQGSLSSLVIDGTGVCRGDDHDALFGILDAPISSHVDFDLLSITPAIISTMLQRMPQLEHLAIMSTAGVPFLTTYLAL